MRVKKEVRVEAEVEVTIDTEDITSALREELSYFEDADEPKCHRSIGLITTCARVLRAIPDEHVDEMTDMQRKCIRDFFIEQARRYRGKSDTPSPVPAIEEA